MTDEINEIELKMKFRDFFGEDMIKHLDEESTAKMNLAELLWVGFAHGYKACEEDNKNEE